MVMMKSRNHLSLVPIGIAILCPHHHQYISSHLRFLRVCQRDPVVRPSPSVPVERMKRSPRALPSCARRLPGLPLPVPSTSLQLVNRSKRSKRKGISLRRDDRTWWAEAIQALMEAEVVASQRVSDSYLCFGSIVQFWRTHFL